MRQQQFTGGSQTNVPPDTIEQRKVQLSLELVDLVRERWLRDMEFCCGLREVGCLRDGQEVAQVAKFDHPEIHRWHLWITWKQTISASTPWGARLRRTTG